MRMRAIELARIAHVFVAVHGFFFSLLAPLVHCSAFGDLLDDEGEVDGAGEACAGGRAAMA